MSTNYEENGYVDRAANLGFGKTLDPFILIIILFFLISNGNGHGKSNDSLLLILLLLLLITCSNRFC